MTIGGEGSCLTIIWKNLDRTTMMIKVVYILTLLTADMIEIPQHVITNKEVLFRWWITPIP
jgi:hypothetical protein